MPSVLFKPAVGVPVENGFQIHIARLVHGRPNEVSQQFLIRTVKAGKALDISLDGSQDHLIDIDERS